jgi:hypothetical protein
MKRRSMVRAENLETQRGERATEKGRCLLCAGGGNRKASIVEMFRNEGVETGAPEEQMVKYQRVLCAKYITEQKM